MKNILQLLLALPFTCFSQVSPDLQKELLSIIDTERKGAEGFFQNGMQSNASGNFNVHHYRCEWRVDPAVRYITGKVTSTFSITSPTNSITFDCTSLLTIDSVIYHAASIPFQRDITNTVTIQFPTMLALNAKDSVSIYYEGVPPGTGFGSFHQGLNSGGVPGMWTLSEPYGASDWWPCKNGLDDKADSIDILLTYPEAYVGTSIGLLSGEETSGGYITSHFKHRYPIASYLVAIAITNYIVKTDTVMANGKVYPYISYGYQDQITHPLFIYEFYTKECFRFFCSVLGDFPFEKYGQTHWEWSGGMEHQTNSFVLGTSRSLTSHELAHQWFGDLVTCGSWSHIWLNEGFANYFSVLYFEKFYPPINVGLMNTARTQITSVADGSVFCPDTSDVNRIFSSRLSYNKGMYAVHMLRWVLGDTLFFRGLRQYLNDPKLRFGFAKTEDLQRNLEQVTGKNLSQFFQQWIYGQGWPSYSATYSLNNNLWVKVKLNQVTSHPSVSFYQMPVELVFRNGQQTKKFVVDHKFDKQEFWLNVGFVPDTLMIDPDEWILAKIRTSAKENGASNKNDEVIVYPNPSPSDGTVILRNPRGTVFSTQLYNALGQLVFSKTIPTPGRDEVISLPFSRLAKGTYWLRLTNDKNLKIVKKIIH